jgi:hypothetical protein
MGMPDTQERRIDEAQSAMTDSADEMQRRNDELAERIDGTKEQWEQAKKSESTPTAAGDWEDTDDDAGGDDAVGFDDPEKDEEDEDEDATADD